MAESAIFSALQRRVAIAWACVAVAAVMATSFFIRGQRAYWVAWVFAAAPFTTPTLLLSYTASHRAARAYKPFWRGFFLGLAMAYAAGIAAIFGRFFGIRALIVIAAVLGVASYPFFFWAGTLMLGARAGGRASPVDLLDVAISVIGLAAPVFYFLFVPAIHSDDPLAVALAIVGVSTLGLLYIAILNFFRLPRGERSGEILFSTLCALTTANVLLVVVQILNGYAIASPPLFAVHMANMTALLMTPLFASSLETEPALNRLLPISRVRRIHALPYVALMLVPPLAVYAQRHSEATPWGPGYVMAVLVLLIAVAAIRQYVSSRETRRLNAELERVAAQRRELLARMVRALEDERHRFGAELHETTLEAFAAMGTLVQTAYAQLPPDTAEVVREALASIREDMNARAEHVRRLMLAVRPAVIEEAGLSAAFAAYASELFGESARVRVDVEVDPDLRLDWSAQTIIYRLAQECLLNVSKHAEASSVSIRVSEADGTVLLEVADDGCGFDVSRRGGGAGIAAMESLAALGRGTIDVESDPGSGCLVRARLGVEAEESTNGEGDTSGKTGGLHLIVGADATEAEGTGRQNDRGA